MDDTRNVIDEFKGVEREEIVRRLDITGVELEIAIENLERDFNMGTIIRTANAFGVRTVHVIGSRQWNKRGAMMTDKYLHVVYHDSVETFISSTNREIIAIDNVKDCQPLHTVNIPRNAVLIFGSESSGLSIELLKHATQVVAIEQFGSTRSINVASAAAIAMYEWNRRYVL